jgi:hypothetical protein
MLLFSDGAVKTALDPKIVKWAEVGEREVLCPLIFEQKPE